MMMRIKMRMRIRMATIETVSHLALCFGLVFGETRASARPSPRRRAHTRCKRSVQWRRARERTMSSSVQQHVLDERQCRAMRSLPGLERTGPLCGEPGAALSRAAGAALRTTRLGAALRTTRRPSVRFRPCRTGLIPRLDRRNGPHEKLRWELGPNR